MLNGKKATSETVTLSREGVDIDVRRLIHPPADPNSQLAALRAYRGELLKGLVPPSPEFGTWLETERREPQMQATRKGLTLAETAPPEIAEEAARLVLKIEPASETAFAILARDLADRGEKIEALHLFHDLEKALREGLDAEPSAQTRALVAALPNSDTPLPRQPRSAPELAPVADAGPETRPQAQPSTRTRSAKPDLQDPVEVAAPDVGATRPAQTMPDRGHRGPSHAAPRSNSGLGRGRVRARRRGACQ